MSIELTERAPQTLVGLRETVPMTELTDFFGRAFTASAEELARHGSAPAGPAMALYHHVVDGSVDVTAGFPVEEPPAPSPGLVVDPVPGGATVETIHVGPYDSLTATYGEVTGWLTEHGIAPAEEMWEEYLVGPDVEPDPALWQTRIVFPVG